MDAWNYRHRALTLHDLLEELEDPDNISEPPQGIILFPPDNANDDITDEDSGEENEMSINDLPGSQLRAKVDIIGGDGSDLEDDLPLSYIQSKNRSRLLDDIDIPGVDDGFESEDDLPLSHFRNPRDGPRRPIAKKKERYQWVKKYI
ncbi:hypothetical protein JTB14_021741 [Gonioctena quinquepunctata]|nr:hypothetical protein JTB14_021741 [Gonioctena quinquepunctata]